MQATPHHPTRSLRAHPHLLDVAGSACLFWLGLDLWTWLQGPPCRMVSIETPSHSANETLLWKPSTCVPS